MSVGLSLSVGVYRVYVLMDVIMTVDVSVGVLSR